jgi:hypothetical protein
MFKKNRNVSEFRAAATEVLRNFKGFRLTRSDEIKNRNVLKELYIYLVNALRYKLKEYTNRNQERPFKR